MFNYHLSLEHLIKYSKFAKAKRMIQQISSGLFCLLFIITIFTIVVLLWKLRMYIVGECNVSVSILFSNSVSNFDFIFTVC